MEEKKRGKELLIPSSPSAFLLFIAPVSVLHCLYLPFFKKENGAGFFCRSPSKGTIRMPAMPDFPLILVFQPPNWASDPGWVVQRVGPWGVAVPTWTWERASRDTRLCAVVLYDRAERLQSMWGHCADLASSLVSIFCPLRRLPSLPPPPPFLPSLPPSFLLFS